MLSEEKARRKRERMIAKAREYTVGTYKNRFVATIFQRMIRAEAASRSGVTFPAIVDGELRHVNCGLGECVCVTCGKVGLWSSGLGGMHTGHFLASRANSVVFEEDNVAPQCSYCNRYQSGATQHFRQWMIAVRGAETVERLARLKGTTVNFTREELVDMRIEYKRRLDEAVALLDSEGQGV